MSIFMVESKEVIVALLEANKNTYLDVPIASRLIMRPRSGSRGLFIPPLPESVVLVLRNPPILPRHLRYCRSNSFFAPSSPSQYPIPHLHPTHLLIVVSEQRSSLHPPPRSSGK